MTRKGIKRRKKGSLGDAVFQKEQGYVSHSLCAEKRLPKVMNVLSTGQGGSYLNFLNTQKF